MPWSRRFDDPIIAEGKTLLTLEDAAAYIQSLPRKVYNLPHWEEATKQLIDAAEDRNFVMQARIAMMRAMNHGKPPPVRERKKAKKFRIVR